jgi:hypothetical protein
MQRCKSTAEVNRGGKNMYGFMNRTMDKGLRARSSRMAGRLASFIGEKNPLQQREVKTSDANQQNFTISGVCLQTPWVIL